MLDQYPTYWPYRALRLTHPLIRGEDVFALQLALSHVLGEPLEADGVLGPITSQCVFEAQAALQKNPYRAGAVDGIAGQATQRALAIRIAKGVKEVIPLPAGLPTGQIAHESSFLLGNYSKPPRSDGSYDAGVVQMNTALHDPEVAFDPVDSIQTLCARVRAAYEKYGKVSDERRRWELAVGSWNAPAYTDYLAGEGGSKPSAGGLVALEAYIDSACAYMVV